MKIDYVKLVNFRNYDRETITFKDGLNVIIGRNAQGKTNLLEAVFYFAIARSTRTHKDKDLITHGKDSAKIEIQIQKNTGKILIEVFFFKKGKKSILINKTPIKRVGELFQEFNAVFFSPDELKLIKESPEDRRRFMDIDISQTSKTYFYLISRYEKVLENRNRLLKMYSSIDRVKETISIWDDQLADLSLKIIAYRLKFLENLSPFAQKAHEYLTGGEEKLSLEYASSVVSIDSLSKEKLIKAYEKNLDKDYKLGFTTIGPHRDDIKILVNNIDIRLFGSQGQQRTTALSMKLAELEIIKNETGETPVLLLDDVFSELDSFRRNRLIKFAKKAQTLITCTDFEFDKEDNNLITIKNGTIC